MTLRPETWSPRPRPQRRVFEGRFARLEPLDAARHGADLRRAFADRDALWTYMAYGPFASEGAFRDWLAGRAALDDPLAFAVLDRACGEARGLMALMNIRPEHGVVEIGHIVFGPALQRTPAATEAVALLGRHIFDDLGYRRLEWKCDALNAPSRRAAERLGFRFEGIFVNHMVVKGRSRDTAWFAMTDADWPDRRAALAAWLARENFDDAGRQRRPLQRGVPR